MATYEATLASARVAGAATASDPELMALFCDGSLQLLVGAVSPKLVWQGAQAKGLSSRDLARLAGTDALAVSDLQWVE